MPAATMTSRGQLTVPKEIRERLGLYAGDRVEFQLEDDGTARLLPVCLTASDVAGILASQTKVKATVEQMDEAVAEAFPKGSL